MNVLSGFRALFDTGRCRLIVSSTCMAHTADTTDTVSRCGRYFYRASLARWQNGGRGGETCCVKGSSKHPLQLAYTQKKGPLNVTDRPVHIYLSISPLNWRTDTGNGPRSVKTSPLLVTDYPSILTNRITYLVMLILFIMSFSSTAVLFPHTLSFI